MELLKCKLCGYTAEGKYKIRSMQLHLQNKHRIFKEDQAEHVIKETPAEDQCEHDYRFLSEGKPQYYEMAVKDGYMEYCTKCGAVRK